MLVNKDAYQRETLTKWPVRLRLTARNWQKWKSIPDMSMP